MTTSSGNSDEKIRVAYYDDQLLFREALGSALEDSGAITVIQSSSHGDRDIQALLDSPVAAILVALKGQTNDPMATVREAQHVAPEIPLCALVPVDRLSSTQEALAAGCKGAVSTSATLQMLIAALQSLKRGEAFVDPTLGGRLIATTISRVVTSRSNKDGLDEPWPVGASEISKMYGGKRSS